MKVRIEMEIDLFSGAYDVRFHNLTRPGEDIDVAKLTGIMHRVIDSVAVKNPGEHEHDHDHVEQDFVKHDIN